MGLISKPNSFSSEEMNFRLHVSRTIQDTETLMQTLKHEERVNEVNFDSIYSEFLKSKYYAKINLTHVYFQIVDLEKLFKFKLKQFYNLNLIDELEASEHESKFMRSLPYKSMQDYISVPN
jgi:hypothetical protein